MLSIPESAGNILRNGEYDDLNLKAELQKMWQGIDYEAVALDYKSLVDDWKNQEEFDEYNSEILPLEWGFYETAFRRNSTKDAVEAHDRLLTKNAQLVAFALTKVAPQNDHTRSDIDEAFAVGLSNASEAIWKYEATDTGHNLRTHIIKNVVWGLSEYLARNGFPVRISQHAFNQAMQLHRWAGENGLDETRLTQDDLKVYIEETKRDPVQVKQAYSILNEFIIPRPLGGDQRLTDYNDIEGEPIERKTSADLSDSFEQTSYPTPEEALEQLEMAQILGSAYRRLVTPRVWDMTRRHFGLYQDPETLQIVAKTYGINRSRVRFLIFEAFEKLENVAEIVNLNEDDESAPVRRQSDNYKSPEHHMQERAVKKSLEVDKFAELRKEQIHFHIWGGLAEELKVSKRSLQVIARDIYQSGTGVLRVGRPEVKAEVERIAKLLSPLLYQQTKLEIDLRKRAETLTDEAKAELEKNIAENKEKIDNLIETEQARVFADS